MRGKASRTAETGSVAPPGVRPPRRLPAPVMPLLPSRASASIQIRRSRKLTGLGACRTLNEPYARGPRRAHSRRRLENPISGRSTVAEARSEARTEDAGVERVDERLGGWHGVCSRLWLKECGVTEENLMSSAVAEGERCGAARTDEWRRPSLFRDRRLNHFYHHTMVVRHRGSESRVDIE